MPLYNTETEPSILWEPRNHTPSLAPGELHLWCSELLAGSAEVHAALEALSPQERARAQRFAFSRDHRRYVMAHKMMRFLLAGYLQVAPETLAFAAGEHGKPQLVGERALQFNLSHSQELAVIAICRHAEVGIDTEWMPSAVTSLPVDQLSIDEQAAYRCLPKEEKIATFYAWWTRKEALLKGIGIGLLGELASFSVSNNSQHPTVHADADPLLRSLANWRVRTLLPAHDYIGSVAMDRDWTILKCFRFMPPKV